VQIFDLVDVEPGAAVAAAPPSGSAGSEEGRDRRAEDPAANGADPANRPESGGGLDVDAGGGDPSRDAEMAGKRSRDDP
jgi:hypothetical protein